MKVINLRRMEKPFGTMFQYKILIRRNSAEKYSLEIKLFIESVFTVNTRRIVKIVSKISLKI